MSERTRGTPVLALRYAEGELYDVVAEDVSMFHAEMMSEKEMWLCCYFGDGDEDEPLTLSVCSKHGRLIFEVMDKPGVYVDWDARESA